MFQKNDNKYKITIQIRIWNQNVVKYLKKKAKQLSYWLLNEYVWLSSFL